MNIKLIRYPLIEDEARDSHLVSLRFSFPFVKWIEYYLRGDARTSEFKFARVFVTGTDGSRNNPNTAVSLTGTAHSAAFAVTPHAVPFKELCAQGGKLQPIKPTH